MKIYLKIMFFILFYGSILFIAVPMLLSKPSDILVSCGLFLIIITIATFFKTIPWLFFKQTKTKQKNEKV